MNNQVHLALGSNLGNKKNNIITTLKLIDTIGTGLISSKIYSTPPSGFSFQPNFLNSACKFQTEKSVYDLLNILKKFESHLGRKQNFKNGPRMIDIDILYYNNLYINTPILSVPHPKIHERDFVLHPLSEISPDFIDPIHKISVNSMLTNLKNSSDKKIQFQQELK